MHARCIIIWNAQNANRLRWLLERALYLHLPHIYHYIYVVYTDSYDKLCAVITTNSLWQKYVSDFSSCFELLMSVLLDQLEHDLVSSSNVHNCKSHC